MTADKKTVGLNTSNEVARLRGKIPKKDIGRLMNVIRSRPRTPERWPSMDSFIHGQWNVGMDE